jgi:hypothetical protein
MRLKSADSVAAAKTPLLSVQPRRAAIVIIGRDDLRRLIAMGTRAVEYHVSLFRFSLDCVFHGSLTSETFATQLCSILLAELQVESSEQTTAPSKVAQVDHEALGSATQPPRRGMPSSFRACARGQVLDGGH